MKPIYTPIDGSSSKPSAYAIITTDATPCKITYIYSVNSWTRINVKDIMSIDLLLPILIWSTVLSQGVSNRDIY